MSTSSACLDSKSLDAEYRSIHHHHFVTL